MSTPTSQKSNEKTSGDGADTQRKGSELSTSRGSTSIADTVVQKIAGIAAREVSGVHGLGGGAARAMGALRERIPGASASAGQGVAVEVGEKQAAVDLELLVEYGISIVDLAQAVRRNVITSIERMTGLEVVEVNISVNDINIPGEESEQESSESTGRVQ